MVLQRRTVTQTISWQNARTNLHGIDGKTGICLPKLRPGRTIRRRPSGLGYFPTSGDGSTHARDTMYMETYCGNTPCKVGLSKCMTAKLSRYQVATSLPLYQYSVRELLCTGLTCPT